MRVTGDIKEVLNHELAIRAFVLNSLAVCMVGVMAFEIWDGRSKIERLEQENAALSDYNERADQEIAFLAKYSPNAHLRRPPKSASPAL